MQDSLGREISYMRLSVTDRCNCRCVYCMPEEGVEKRAHSDLLSFEELAEIVRAATQLGVHKVRITGGEPLARRGVENLVKLVTGIDGIDEIAMTTNATLLADKAEVLRAAGLTRLNISLDTLCAEHYRTITRVGELEDALAGLDAARSAGFTGTKINCVLMGGINDDEIADFVELTHDEPYEVRFIELMPMGECATWPAERFVAADEVLAAVPEFKACGTSGVAELYQVSGYAGRVGLIRAVSHRFCERCDRIRVTADGKLKPCLHSASEIDLRGLVGEELVAALKQGVMAKPAHHNLNPGVAASATPRDMNQIGG